MTILTQTEGLLLLAGFGAAMILLVWLRTHSERHADGFLVADRNVSLWHGSFSIAVSWIWAPAIFICSLQAYTKGLPGIFWFTAPNILCFFLFAPLAIRLRRLMPYGYTLPEFITQKRFAGHTPTHVAFLAVFFGYQLGAIVINALAGGTLLHAISGIDIRVAILGMAAIALAYSLLSGLKASVFTDVIQMSMVLLICFILVPWCLAKGGGFSAVSAGLAGIDGTHSSLFDPWIAFTMGIPMTFGLIAGPIGDQMFFQRAMAVKIGNIVKTFVYGGLIFGVVPIVLSLLGFLGVPLAQSGAITVEDPQLIGPIVIAHLLPKAALFVFCLMAFAGLCSTLDSAFCAISSLGGIDIYKRYFNQEASSPDLLRVARRFMIVMAIIGTGIALLQPQLLWVFLVYGALASAGMFPTVFALFSKSVTARGACWAVGVSLLIGTPLSIYANVKENPYLVVVAAVLSVLIGLVICVVSAVTNREKPYDYASLLADGQATESSA